jgi:SAM-dependent methyltransferase
MKEGFRPISNTAPKGFAGTIKFHFRFIFDLQNASIYGALKKFLKPVKGRVLDVGCGDSPYAHLLGKGCEYIGVDTKGQKDFDYNNKCVVFFKGSKIPLKNNSVDAVICTEVLEHIKEPGRFLSEIKRVLKKGGTGIITVPWSARYHYIPYDYFRYTPAGLEHIFRDFSSVRIENRGTDITAICSKAIVAAVRALIPDKIAKLLLLPVAVIFALPVLLLAVILGNLSLIAGLGSKDDPLGYTVTIKK